MDEEIRRALRTDQTIDITTTGRKTGLPRRIEIWFHNVDDRIFITGTPGTRDWYANLAHTSDFVFHLKESVQADLQAQARPIEDEGERRTILSRILRGLSRQDELEKWVKESPLVEVTFPHL